MILSRTLPLKAPSSKAHPLLLVFFLYVFCSPNSLHAQAQLQRLDMLAGGQIIGASLALPLSHRAELFLNKRWNVHAIRVYLPHATLRVHPHGQVHLEATRPHPRFALRYDPQRRLQHIDRYALEYNELGRIQRIGKIHFTYDKFGRIEQIDTLLLRYDINARITQVGTLLLRYGNNQKPHQIGDIKLTYDDQDRLQQIDTQRLLYDSLNAQLLSIQGHLESPRLIVHWDLKETGRRLQYGD